MTEEFTHFFGLDSSSRGLQHSMPLKMIFPYPRNLSIENMRIDLIDSLSAGLALFWGEGPALSPKFELSAGLKSCILLFFII